MKTQLLFYSTLLFFLVSSLNSGAQITNSGSTTSNEVYKEKTDSLSKPIIITDAKDKEVYETIKPNTLISTREYELLLEEKKKKTQVKDPK